MSGLQTCPICHKEGIPQEQNKCPQCDSDLSCFKILEVLPVTKSRQILRNIFIFLIIITVIPLLSYQIYQNNKITKQIMFNQEQLENFNTVVEEIKSKEEEKRTVFFPEQEVVTENEKQPSYEEKVTDKSNELVEEKNKSFFIYTSTDDDTPWDIAKKFYNHGQLYPVLLEHNPELAIFDLKGGQKINILKDYKYAIKLCKDLIKISGSQKYFRYQVREGDTLEDISRRFYGSKRLSDYIIKVNPDILGQSLKSGVRINILLEE